MDQELVQYLEERFERQERRFYARFDTIEQRFDRVEQRLDSHDQKFVSIDQRLALIDQRFTSVDQQFISVDQRFDELKRHTGVLVEGLRHEIHHVAEGLLMHIEVRHREDREYFDRKFEDAYALIRSSHDHLQQQQDQTRQRVENLERKSPN